MQAGFGPFSVLLTGVSRASNVTRRPDLPPEKTEMTGTVLCKRLARAAGVRRTSQKDENNLILVKVKRMGGEIRGAERRRSLSGEGSRTGTSGQSRGVEEKERHWREHLAGMTPGGWHGGAGGRGGLCDSSDHWLLFAYSFMASEHIWTVKKDCTGTIVQVIVGWPGVSHSVPRGPGFSILVLKD